MSEPLSPPPEMLAWRDAASGRSCDDRPLLVVHGNCQAESLRVLLSEALGEGVRTVRVPPVFELVANDISAFHDLVRRTDLFVTQPIVDDYRDLPLGHRQLTALLGADARVAIVPVLRWAALHPTHVIVRAAGVGDPPVVPYHDLRVLAAASRGDEDVELVPPSPEGVRAIRDLTRAQLLTRQAHHGTVDAVGHFERAGAEATWTLNHPQNVVLRGVATEILERLGADRSVSDPGRTLLSTTIAPIEPGTLNALSLSGEARAGWMHQGRAISEQEVADAHLDWYRQHPAVVAAGLRRHADAVEALELQVCRAGEDC